MDRIERPALPAHRGAGPGLHAVILVLGLAAAGPARADCPRSWFGFGDGPPRSESTAAVRDTTFGPVDGCDFGSASYDLTRGVLALDYRPCLQKSAGCVLQDSFTIVGPPRGTGLRVFAIFDLSGDTPNPCGGSGCAVLRKAVLCAGAGADSVGWVDAGPHGAELVVPVDAIVGEPFFASAGLWLTLAGSGGVLQGSIYFQGLPPGAGVRSCQGFAQEPTPTPDSSWGRIKARYR
jgi:hypothetical protein